MHRERLTKLADFLEKLDLAPHKFHLADWMGSYGHFARCTGNDRAYYETVRKFVSDSNEPAFTTNDDGTVQPIDCKTAGCAIGWAIAGIPEFRKEGFVFVQGATSDGNTAVPSYKGFHNYVAVARFFDISVGTAMRLFSQEYYTKAERRDPKAVAERVREQLEGIVRYDDVRD